MNGTLVARFPYCTAVLYCTVPYCTVLLQNITHRNLAGSDSTDCSMVFIYMLCSICLRPNLQSCWASPPRRSQPTPAQAASQFFGLPTETN